MAEMVGTVVVRVEECLGSNLQLISDDPENQKDNTVLGAAWEENS